MGLATDGGLLLPSRIPWIRAKLEAWRHLEYPELAVAVMREFSGNEIPQADLAALIKGSYAGFDSDETVPVVDLDPIFFVELFRGPTLAFKDIALQFLGNLFEYILEQTGDRLNILGVTSGDTGSAAIYGVRGKSNMDVFIMHPDGRVSPLQRQQMTAVLDPNVHNIAVRGNFDDTQRILKQIFNDNDFKEEYRLGAVNSVNWARILAQIVYYFYAAFRVQEKTGCEMVQFCVPTGNFGNIFAGYMAHRMGAPINRLILATNENDILSRFFQTGIYERGDVHATMSPSMDIQIASNFERYLYYRCGEDGEKVAKLISEFVDKGRLEVPGPDPLFAGECGTTEQMLNVMRDTYVKHDYVLDPHSAVGVAVGQRHCRANNPVICLGTAHPAKFPEAVRQALGADVASHPRVDAIMDLPTRCTTLPADAGSVESFIRESLAGEK